jgi:hypothetical protein
MIILISYDHYDYYYYYYCKVVYGGRMYKVPWSAGKTAPPRRSIAVHRLVPGMLARHHNQGRRQRGTDNSRVLATINLKSLQKPPPLLVD